MAVSCHPQAAEPSAAPAASIRPHYAYGYDIKSDDTFDEKSHTETAENGVTKGQFSVLQPDGVLRTHTYEVTSDGGFNVNVEYKRVSDPLPTFVQRIVQQVEDVAAAAAARK